MAAETPGVFGQGWVGATRGRIGHRRRIPSLRVPFLTTVAVGAATAVVALPGQEAPPPAVTTEAVELTAPAAPVGAGWTGEAEVDPELVGVEWEGDGPAAFTVETRDAAGTWAAAGTVEALSPDEGPDDGSADAARGPAGNVSEPLWVGEGVTAVRVRLDEGTAADVELHAVDSPPAAAPDGSAVADGGVGITGSGIDTRPRQVALVVLVAATLGIVLTRRRRVLAAVVVASLALTACVPGSSSDPNAAPAGMITRAGWGADEGLRTRNCPAGPDYMPSGVRFAVVHHTVNSNSYAPGQGAQLVRGIYGYHTQSLGYCDIAYNFLVDRYGNLFEGRFGGAGRAVMGAHARGFNTSSTGVALIGDFRSAVPPPAMLNRLEEVLAWKLGVHGINPWDTFSYQTAGNEKFAPGTVVTLTRITSHNYTGYSECPGAQVINRLGDISFNVARRMGY